MPSFDLFLVLEEIGLPVKVGWGWKLLPFENCVAAARAPAMASVSLSDFLGSDSRVAFDGLQTSTDPGFKEWWSCGSGSGNLTGNGGETGERPLMAASNIYDSTKVTEQGKSCKRRNFVYQWSCKEQ